MEAIKTVRYIADKMGQEGKKLYASLTFDEMYIRKHVMWRDDKKKFSGFISYGYKKDNGELPVANQALVFLLTRINFEMSFPIAYFFITGLKAIQKAFLIREIIKEITSDNIKVINITFDGLASNFAACRLLGASFDLKDFRPYFFNPQDKNKVNVMLDACHMLKCIRNTLGSEQVIFD